LPSTVVDFKAASSVPALQTLEDRALMAKLLPGLLPGSALFRRGGGS
jgi:hypothetical protein